MRRTQAVLFLFCFFLPFLLPKLPFYDSDYLGQTHSNQKLFDTICIQNGKITSVYSLFIVGMAFVFTFQSKNWISLVLRFFYLLLCFFILLITLFSGPVCSDIKIGIT
jgi:hypothetical protein